MEPSSKVEYYYDIALTPEVYAFVQGLGYNWANNLDRFRYLMHSIQASGRCWETIKKRLQIPKNIREFRYGPEMDEPWTLEQSRLEKLQGTPVTPGQTVAIYNKWLHRKMSHTLWYESVRD